VPDNKKLSARDLAALQAGSEPAIRTSDPIQDIPPVVEVQLPPDPHLDLRETREWLLVTLSSIGDAVITTDTHGRVRFLNPVAQELTGWTQEQAVGHSLDHVFKIVNETTRAPVVNPAIRALREGIIVGLANHTILIARDGAEHPIDDSAAPIRNAKGEAAGVVLVFRDITERRATEEALRLSEMRYRRLFQSAKDGILILDASTGKIIDSNAFMSGLLGQTLPELIGKELWEIGLFGDIDANKDVFQRLKQDGYVRYDHLPVQKPSGETTHVEFISNVYEEGGRLVAQCNVRDISARVAMEERIKQQAEALANQARHKDEFLAMLSHELRNPLAPIRSATHLLRLQERGTENPIQQQAREVIERQVTTLTRLVSDLMEVSRALTGRIRLNLETVDLNQLLRHALETTKPLIETRGHTISAAHCPGPLWTTVDPMRIEEVLVNLLVNAAKYTHENGRIEVACERHGNHALVRVRDNGAGIEKGLLPRIFDLFSQADRTLDRAQGGLGIGLSLAHRIVELHAGTIEAHSEGPGSGSEFIVRLPLAPAPGRDASTATPETAAPHPGGLRVLVVDDNVDACLMLANLVRLRGHGVQTSHTGPGALAMAESWVPDVMLLDIGLPELDGYEVARRLRASSATRSIKLIAITGYGADKDVEVGREAGFEAHLVKPVELDEIERLLSAWKLPV
jgi:PAS domain S-box-containing protein